MQRLDVPCISKMDHQRKHFIVHIEIHLQKFLSTVIFKKWVKSVNYCYSSVHYIVGTACSSKIILSMLLRVVVNNWNLRGHVSMGLQLNLHAHILHQFILLKISSVKKHLYVVYHYQVVHIINFFFYSVHVSVTQ